ncbi:ABC transporter substrate-binding protein [Petroclostridium sp. X23]|uniref:ABC transporter substrate-binding protein n=1 Tax=Petroclostridium sp. X23 TaxID=3045146 RepID=UPI0024ACCB95|nr:ABC transporter substrate-binding protein [Petroclostridium sp. X23]WHH58700.1 ABC transporter substrate-binding protein [Petroclostridium sp. X23]
MKGVVGTGPYVYSEIKNGEYVRVVKKENYWGEKPYYDEIIVKYITEASARLLALQKREIDMIYGSTLISWDDYKQVTSKSNTKGIVSTVDTKTVSLVLNAANPMLSDKSVREAIAYGIDKQAICDGLFYSNQNPAPDLFPDDNFLSDVKLNVVRTYNKGKAEQLLESTGWKMNTNTGLREKDGKPLSFKLTYDSGEAMNKMSATYTIDFIQVARYNLFVLLQCEGYLCYLWYSIQKYVLTML